MIKNIIFDLDGVLFDGCDFHKILFLNALSTIKPELNITSEYHDTHLNGMTTKQKLKILNINEDESKQISDLKQALTKDSIGLYIKQSDLQKKMCKTLVDLGYKIYCVSNSIRSTVETCLYNLGIIDNFSGIISNEDTTEPKPSPQPYLTAYSKWNLDPKECLIVEDSPYGIQSARLSGGNVLPVEGVNDVRLELILHHINNL